MHKLKKTAKQTTHERDGKRLFWMAMPFMIFIFVFNYLPLWGWSFAFVNYKPGRSVFESDWVGLSNFTTLFMQPAMRTRLFEVIRNTLGLQLINYLLMPLPMFFAVFLNELRSVKFRKFVQTVTTLPNFISWVILYALAYGMLAVDTGFVNNVLKQLGVIENGISFLTSSDHVWLKMALLSLWKSLGWNAIVYLAAIAGLDHEILEAAEVDGAGRMRRIWHIILPQLIPTFFVLLIMSIGNFLNTGMEQQQLFSNAMTKPYIETLDLYVYNMGIGSGLISYSTAVGVMKSVISIILFAGANWFSKLVRGTSAF
ncbi:MAG: ABC transporter permease subunit [Lachnospiraceae bacterium]|nr:ABC transporter permease subunit [Lachnospiraceae bacterium]